MMIVLLIRIKTTFQKANKSRSLITLHLAAITTTQQWLALMKQQYQLIHLK